MPTELSCLLHVHSTYSDGTATVPELVRAAAEAGADVLAITDHDTLQAARDGWEGWRDGVLVVVGHEISPYRGHLLAFETGEEIAHRGRSEAEVCAAVARTGGFGIAAHPFSEGSRISRRIGRPHPWGAFDAPACVGVEVWSLVTDVAESWSSPRQIWRSLRRPERVLDGPPDRHLRLWDALCARRPTVGVAGLDAHQPGLRVAGRVRTIMPHTRWFGLVRTQVLLDEPPTGDSAADGAAVLGAIRRGRCYLARVDLGLPEGFDFHASDREGRTLRMGAEAPAESGWSLEATSPASAGLRLMRDGREVASTTGRRLRHRAKSPGAYRVEARRTTDGHWRRWIVSNPVYLR